MAWATLSNLTYEDEGGQAASCDVTILTSADSEALTGSGGTGEVRYQLSITVGWQTYSRTDQLPRPGPVPQIQ